jgi:transposase
MFYCGIDLSARDSCLCVIDESLSIIVQQKVRNDLSRIINLLEPFKPDIRIVVESTFNWYWLIDGLQAAGFEVHLAHSLGLAMITSAKVKTDRRDAFTLAKLLLAGVIPQSYIYPAHTRPVRDLLRRRLQLVQLRAREYGSLRHLLLREGILSSSRNEIKHAAEEELQHWFNHPLLLLHARQELERIKLYNEQIDKLEETILQMAQLEPCFQKLLQISGIGKILALTIFYEVGEISRFENVRHFCSYCRLIPGVAQSGQVTRRGRASKQGNHYLKSAFSQAAVAAVRCYPRIHSFYECHLKKHRGSARKLVVYNIIAHKLAQAVYYVLRDRTDFRVELLFGS